MHGNTKRVINLSLMLITSPIMREYGLVVVSVKDRLNLSGHMRGGKNNMTQIEKFVKKLQEEGCNYNLSYIGHPEYAQRIPFIKEDNLVQGVEHIYIAYFNEDETILLETLRNNGEVYNERTFSDVYDLIETLFYEL